MSEATACKVPHHGTAVTAPEIARWHILGQIAMVFGRGTRVQSHIPRGSASAARFAAEKFVLSCRTSSVRSQKLRESFYILT